MRILIIKMSALGDILQTLPAVKHIHNNLVDVQIDWVVERKFSEALHSLPFLHKVIAIDSKKPKWREDLARLRHAKYDYALDLQGNCKSALIAFLCRSKRKIGYTLKQCAEWPNALVSNQKFSRDITKPMIAQYAQFTSKALNLPNASHDKAIFLEDVKQKKVEGFTIMVCFGSNWENKKLSVKQLIDLLNIRKAHYLLIWKSEEEKAQAMQIAKHIQSATLLGDLTIATWQQVMSTCQGVICMDSAALHLSYLAGSYTFSVFGPTNSRLFAPIGKGHKTFQGSCPYNMAFSKRCKMLRTCKTGACMKGIEMDKLKQAYGSWIDMLIALNR